MAGAVRWTRRTLGKVAALAAAAGGTVLAACATPKGQAAPTVSQTATELSFMPWWIYWSSAGKGLLAEITQQFSDQHKGLRLTALPGPQGGGASTANVVTSMIAGTGPDVVGDCCAAWFTYNNANAFLNLSPYIQKDNVPLSTWATGQLQALRQSDGQFGLPIYHGPVVCVYNQDLLDQLGLSYPDPAWDYKAATTLWTQCAGAFQKKGGGAGWRYGANFWWRSTTWGTTSFLLHGFGGAEMDSTGTKAEFDQAGSMAAGKWIYPLLWNKVLGPFVGNINDGTAVFSWSGGWSIPTNVTTYKADFKWDYVPMPTWPNGKATFSNNDFWGINAFTKHPDEAWAVLKWLTFEDDWQRFCMKATLLAPSKVALWAEFETQLVASAPILQNKAIKYFREAAEGGYGYPEEFFKYEPTQADSVLSTYMAQIFSQKLSVEGGFGQATQQVDALEAAAAAEAPKQQAIQKAFPTDGPDVAGVPEGI